MKTPMQKQKDGDMEMMRSAFLKRARANFKPLPEWEDKHPILATAIVLGAFLFNWKTILVLGGIIILLILI